MWSSMAAGINRKKLHRPIGRASRESRRLRQEPNLPSQIDEVSRMRAAPSALRTGDFSSTAFGPDKQQTGDIDASDDKQKAGAGEQKERIGLMLPTMTSVRSATAAPWPRLEGG